MRKESRLIAKGYSLARCFFNQQRQEAAGFADDQRVHGRNAQLVTYSTAVKGYHNYAVWVRFPETPNYLDLAKKSLVPGQLYSAEELTELGIPWGVVRALLEVGVLKFHRRNAYSLKEAHS